jgi:hypothetical protein
MRAKLPLLTLLKLQPVAQNVYAQQIWIKRGRCPPVARRVVKRAGLLAASARLHRTVDGSLKRT